MTRIATAMSRSHWDQLAFGCFCTYLMSQAFQVPVATVGPSWAVWPSLPDIIWAMLIVSVIAMKLVDAATGVNTPADCRRVASALALLTSAAAASWAVCWVFAYDSVTFSVGLYQLYRTTQTATAFWALMQIPLSPSRVRILTIVSGVSFVANSVAVVASGTGVVASSVWGGHLPTSPAESGPWAAYARGLFKDGLGAIGYNHGQVAMQVFLGLATYLSMPRARCKVAAIVLGLAAIALTGSRAGLVVAVVFVATIAKRHALLFIVISCLAVLVLTLDIAESNTWIHFSDRHTSSLEAYDADGLSGRTKIWDERLQQLNQNLWQWWTGGGFGSSRSSGENAHMLYLHIVIETGLIGLAAFATLMTFVLWRLWTRGVPARPFFWLTVGLLVMSLTQETFYPVAAFGHFLGFFFCSLGVVLRAHVRVSGWNDYYRVAAI